MFTSSESKMDPANSFLGKLLLEEITPVVMVLLTPLVEESCQKNGLSFIQMLQPFCLFNKIDVPVRTTSDQPYRLLMFKLRLHYTSDIRQQNVEAAEEHLKQVLSNASEKAFSDLQADSPQLEDVLSKAESEYIPSWFQIFNKELLRALSFSEHEAFDHPVACLVVVSSKDEHPINKFVDLFNTDQLPSLLNDGTMDPKILKHYLLVHDNQDGTSEKATNILAEMRSTFGANDCRLLCINSAEAEVGEQTDNPWAPYRSDTSLSQNNGCFLGISDLNEIKNLMQDLSSKHIIPHMEQRIRVLNQQVSATRKGFKNQIRNLWWRKGKEDTVDTPTGLMYTFSSIESQIRVLSDCAFMLRDYELALSNYRLLSTDYKLDKAWKRYAGVQEMMGLSFFMLDQSRKEAEYCMENAFNTYLKLGSSGQRYATRCGLWWVEMLKARGQYKEAASVYFRISNEEPSLHAAVMLEQASYCYLYSNPPMLRKYGFHLVLAGNHYYLSDQRQHAIRTYKSALSVYKGNPWGYIKDHVHFNIGRWFALLGIFDVAIKHMLEVLACSQQSLVTQEILNDFIQIVQNMGKTFEVFRLQLPVINMSSLKIIFEDRRTFASSSAVHVRESLWKSLEEEMVPSISTLKANWLESQTKLSSNKYKDFHICVAGEPIKVDIQFKNPLRISLSISGVSLICELSARSESTESGDVNLNYADQDRSATGLPAGVELKSSGTTSLTLSEVDFELDGRETMVVQLSVTPEVEGILKIVGVRWTLSGSIVGYHNFDSGMAKKKDLKGRKNVSSRHNFKFIVIKSIPKLEGCIRRLPRKAYAGDLRRLTLELRNPSEFAVKNMKMKISHPRFLIPGSPQDMDTEFPDCLYKQKSSTSIDEQADVMEISKSTLFSFPKDATIQGGATFLWPLWLHSVVPGNISLYISIYYEMENFSSDMTYRTLRMHYDLEVFSSLDVSVQVICCPSSLQEFLVRMDIVNRTRSQSFWLRQLSAVGCQWKISSLLPNISLPPSHLLLAGQALSFFFILKDCKEALATKDTVTSPSSLQASDVTMSSQESKEVLFDVSKTPVAEFHQQERLQPGNPIQECPSAVDFILISESDKDNSNLEPVDQSDLPRLLSHHACHCSITSTIPISWLMDGPSTVNHDFSVTFCEIRLHLTIHNCLDAVASIRINTFDTISNTGQSSDASQSSGNQVGWHDVSLGNEMKILSDVQENRSSKPSSLEDITPFVWCASSSTRVELEPMSTTDVPLEICIFSPGTYDLSNYELHWSLRASGGEGSTRNVTKPLSGISRGHPFYITVLQSH